jgi:elongation factor P
MVTSTQLTPGMVLSLDKKLFRVESTLKVTVPKGNPFIKVQLKDIANEKQEERNFKVGQELEEVSLNERTLEFLYLEGKNYHFLDILSLDTIKIPPDVIGDKANFLKEGIELGATFYGDAVFAVELPQFLELMVAKTQPMDEGMQMTNSTKEAVLETGATVEVPPFIETGDIIKIDTKTCEYIQRV